MNSLRRRPKWAEPKQNLLRLLGPGLITGASDNDPSGIATYSQVGAQFGFRMLWTMPFVYPFMGGIQDISARVGRVTGHGIAGNLRRYYPNWVLCNFSDRHSHWLRNCHQPHRFNSSALLGSGCQWIGRSPDHDCFDANGQ